MLHRITYYCASCALFFQINLLHHTNLHKKIQIHQISKSSFFLKIIEQYNSHGQIFLYLFLISNLQFISEVADGVNCPLGCGICHQLVDEITFTSSLTRHFPLTISLTMYLKWSPKRLSNMILTRPSLFSNLSKITLQSK